MVVPKTGRRYIFNTTTKTSRWLNQSVSDLPENTPPQTSIPGRDANANSVPNNPQVTQGPVQGILHHASARAVRRDVRSAPVFQNTTSVTEPNAIDASQSNNVHLPNSDPSFKKVRPIIPPIKATRNENGSLALPNHAESESTDAQNVSGKLLTLNTMLRDIKLLTTSGKYDMSYFRTLQKKDTVQVENNREDSQRLLELEEHLTQQMLKVDAVESDGNQIVRAKRKETVKTILALSEEIEDLRKKLACL